MSLPSLLDQPRAHYGSDLTAQGMIASAIAGDRACARVLADAGQRVGAATAIICNLFNLTG